MEPNIPRFEMLITRRQLATELGIHPATLRRWLKKYGIKLPPGLLRPKDLDKIRAMLEQQPPLPEPEE